MKIENKTVEPLRNIDGFFREFFTTLGKLKVGQSFLVDNVTSAHRTGISAVQYFTGYKFAVRKTETGFRVGRIA